LYSEEYQNLVQKLAEEQAKVQENETKIAVMTMLKEGSVPETLPIPGTHFVPLTCIPCGRGKYKAEL
jgi:hypothetical protein